MANVIVRFLKQMLGLGPGEVRIEFEGRLDLDSSHGFLFEKLRPLFGAQAGAGKFVLDFTKVDFIYPSALTFILIARERLEANGVGLEIELTEGSPIHGYLHDCGLSEYIPLPPLPTDAAPSNLADLSSAPKVFPMKQGMLTGTKSAGERMVDLLKAEQPLSEMAEANVIDSIDEILRNVSNHSKYTNHIMMGQAYPKSQRIRFCVYDNGVGIKNHMTELLYRDRHQRFRELISEALYLELKDGSANKAIEQAARYEVSATNYTANSGAGLAFLINDLSVPTQGVVSIFSGNGFVQWKAGAIERNEALPFEIKGTLVSVTINCDPECVLAYDEEIEEG